MRYFLILVKKEEDLKVYSPIIKRCIVYSMLISNGIRKDVILSFYLLDRKKGIKIYSNTVRRLFPDEQSLEGIYKKFLRYFNKNKREEVKIHPGIFAFKKDLKDLIKNEGRGFKKILIDYKTFTECKKVLLSRNLLVILPFSLESLKNIKSYISKEFLTFGFRGINFLLPDQIICIINHLIDSALY